MTFNYDTQFHKNSQLSLIMSIGSMDQKESNVATVHRKIHRASFSSRSGTLASLLGPLNRTRFRRSASLIYWRYSFYCKAL